MKKLLFLLLFTCFSATMFSQKIAKLDLSNDIPATIKITDENEKSKANSYQQYSDHLEVDILVKGYVNNEGKARILSIILVGNEERINYINSNRTVLTECDDENTDCVETNNTAAGCMRCCTDKPSGIGVILCTTIVLLK